MTTSSITTFTASLNCSVNMINGMVLANQSGIQYQFYVDTIRISNIARYVDGSSNQTAITYNGSILSNDSNTVYITRMDTATPTWTAGTIIGTITATNATTGGLIVNGGIGVTGISYFGNGLSVTDSTVSSSTSTGAVTITGGVGIQGTANINSLSLPTTTGTTLHRFKYASIKFNYYWCNDSCWWYRSKRYYKCKYISIAHYYRYNSYGFK